MPARIWVYLVSVLVPWEDREVWIEEWEGELSATGGGMMHALGALPDAWFLRTEGWTMDRMLREVRLAVKTLARKPFFTALAGITLAIGIGANTAIYSVVDGVLIDPLPYPESDRILSVNHTAPGLNVPLVPHSQTTYLHYTENFQSLEAFSVFRDATVNLVSDAEPRRLRGALVTHEFHDVMGSSPSSAGDSSRERIGPVPSP